MDQKGKNGQQQQPGGLWVAGIFSVALVFLFIVLGGYVQGWEWTGLTTPKQRTMWDWLDLLIVPVVLAIVAYLFTRFENRRTQKIANQRSQDDTLQAYLDHIGSLILDEKASKKLYDLEKVNEEPNKVRTLARARTLTALDQVEGSRKGTIVTFLREAHLILIRDGNWEVAPIIVLSYANLKGASLANTFLEDASLSRADLREADLSGANLMGADLSGANLYEASLNEANLIRADLIRTDLREADLSGANLMGADLSGTKLLEANLYNADLSKANLFRVQGLTNEQVSATRHSSLPGATMPNGQKYENWLKDQEGRGEGAENK